MPKKSKPKEKPKPKISIESKIEHFFIRNEINPHVLENFMRWIFIELIEKNEEKVSPLIIRTLLKKSSFSIRDTNALYAHGYDEGHKKAQIISFLLFCIYSCARFTLNDIKKYISYDIRIGINKYEFNDEHRSIFQNLKIRSYEAINIFMKSCKALYLDNKDSEYYKDNEYYRSLLKEIRDIVNNP